MEEEIGYIVITIRILDLSDIRKYGTCLASGPVASNSRIFPCSCCMVSSFSLSSYTAISDYVQCIILRGVHRQRGAS
jgi:hypothetical protein